MIGGALGVIASAITLVEGLIIAGKSRLQAHAMWPCEASASGCAPSAAGSHTASYFVYAACNVLLISIAAALTYWAPQAAGSGLPQLKAFLNGVNVRDLLTWRTLLAKTVGVTCVVATGLPLGREGPMVHTGAIVAARTTRNEWTSRTRAMLPVRLPSSQRNWVAMGCAAGVAAAFNAPLGGILYSFEEVGERTGRTVRTRDLSLSLSLSLTLKLITPTLTPGVLSLVEQADVALVRLRGDRRARL